jgi:hypothetical protein
MIRTVISISEDDKRWLEEQAAEQGIPMTEVVRRALSLMREKSEREDPPTEDLLSRTQGLWRGEDGLEHQRRLRDEW